MVVQFEVIVDFSDSKPTRHYCQVTVDKYEALLLIKDEALLPINVRKMHNSTLNPPPRTRFRERQHVR